MEKPNDALKVASVATLKAYKSHAARMKRMVRKDQICAERLVVFADAFSALFEDEDFAELLATEKLARMPKCLRDWISSTAP